jgi:hypothetical protein
VGRIHEEIEIYRGADHLLCSTKGLAALRSAKFAENMALPFTEQTSYRWLGKYGGLQLSEAKRLRALEDDNNRLKRLVADLSFDNAMLKDVVGRKW